MNIAQRIDDQAQKLKTKKAIIHPLRNEFITFHDFSLKSSKLAGYFLSQGVQKGDRVLVFIRPGVWFPLVVFSLFKIGALPVLIDPGMGIKNLLNAISKVKPQFLIGEDISVVLRWIFFGRFKSIKRSFRVKALRQLDLSSIQPIPNAVCSPEDKAAILFTSGGTGSPKGVVTTHGILGQQTAMLKEMFDLNETDVDMAGFPLFALFTVAMGMTSIIPNLDASKPAQVDPEKIIPDLLKYQVTFAAGSPAIWDKVARVAQKKNLQFPYLRRVVMFGAPVRGEIHQTWKDLLPNGTTYTPYGATECLPVSLIDGKDVLQSCFQKTQQGLGVCIGKTIPGMEIRILDSQKRVQEAPFKKGEIIVCGPVVTPGYFDEEEATRESKITLDGKMFHRMGDVGYIDDQKRLWFLGRKVHVLGELYPIALEGIVNTIKYVQRSALVLINGLPAIAVEGGFTPEQKAYIQLEVNNKLKHYGEFKVSFIKKFPVDVRHNIKIDRIKLGKLLSKK